MLGYNKSIFRFVRGHFYLIGKMTFSQGRVLHSTRPDMTIVARFEWLERIQTSSAWHFKVLARSDDGGKAMVVSYLDAWWFEELQLSDLPAYLGFKHQSFEMDRIFSGAPVRRRARRKRGYGALSLSA